MTIWTQRSAWIQKRTSRLKFADTNLLPPQRSFVPLWVPLVGLLRDQVVEGERHEAAAELAVAVAAARRVRVVGDVVERAYAATISIRHLTNPVCHMDMHFSISNFELSVLGCIDADVCDLIRVGKILTRSTSSTFFSRRKFSIVI